MLCPNCGRECFGFWKYGKSHACSKKCFRELVENGKITTIPPYKAFPELDILPPVKNRNK